MSVMIVFPVSVMIGDVTERTASGAIEQVKERFRMPKREEGES
jgi:hypothetical protein